MEGGGQRKGREGKGGGEKARRDARRKDCPSQCVQCTPRLLSVIRPKLSFLASVGGNLCSDTVQPGHKGGS